MKFTITMFQDEDGWYVVECPAVPGCMSQGKSEEEAIENIREAIKLCLDVRKEKSMPLTIKSEEIDVPVSAL